MFLDDLEYKNFFRRLSWATDGSFLLTPSAIYEEPGANKKTLYTVYGFLKSDLTEPTFMLPGMKSAATCIKFNPFLF